MNARKSFCLMRICLAGMALTGFVHADWLSEANGRIEQYRKTDVHVVVKDDAGNPVSGATVKINMIRQGYDFGTLIDSRIVLDENYAKIVKDYFNHCVVEIKLPAMENPDVAQRKLAAVKKAYEMGLTVRGHTLVYPGDQYNPAWINQLRISNPTRFLDTNNAYVGATVKMFKGYMKEWDVINECVQDWSTWMSAQGGPITKREVIRLFNTARKNDEGAQYAINETGIITRADRWTYIDAYKRYLDDLLAAGCPIDLIGIQGHYRAKNMYPPASWIVTALDAFNKYNLPIKITEISFDIVDETQCADYMTQVITALYSQKNTTGVVLWGFIEADEPYTLYNGIGMFRKDYTPRKSALAWRDLFYTKWWTALSGSTGIDGSYQGRAFKGAHEVIVEANGETEKLNIDVGDSPLTVTMTFGQGGAVATAHSIPGRIAVTEGIIVQPSAIVFTGEPGTIEMRLYTPDGRLCGVLVSGVNTTGKIAVNRDVITSHAKGASMGIVTIRNNRKHFTSLVSLR